MPDADDPLVFAILAVPESTASTLYGMHEMLESTARDWGMVTRGTPGRQGSVETRNTPAMN